MSSVFADTFYWIALADFKDSAHERAIALTEQFGSSGLVTTDEVLTEYLSYFSSSPTPHSRESFLAGLRMYHSRPDKGYSLTDCISMATMRREGLTDVLTNDRHFEQEGFRALFRD